MSIPRRLGRLARGFMTNLQEDERLNDRARETLRTGRERGETVRRAFEAAWKGASEEWRASEREREAEEAASEERERARERRSEGLGARTWMPKKYPPNVLAAYERLGLDTGTGLEGVHRKRRDLVKRFHPDRFSDPEKRVKAERLTAQINAAHDTIERHLATRG
ncbi:MAG: J domain-containing protein [Rubrobacter sp.]|nr:J domain-containing protein [Rubrobacter sp.]